MIAHLSGTLLSKNPNSVIVDVSGVGYEVNIPVSTFYELEDTGTNVKLRIYTHVKEDALQLYGFKTARERELFINFISVSGIGPKIGIALLSGMSADELIASIKTNNLARLTLIPGVGKKTAELPSRTTTGLANQTSPSRRYSTTIDKRSAAASAIRDSPFTTLKTWRR